MCACICVELFAGARSHTLSKKTHREAHTHQAYAVYCKSCFCLQFKRFVIFYLICEFAYSKASDNNQNKKNNNTKLERE